MPNGKVDRLRTVLELDLLLPCFGLSLLSCTSQHLTPVRRTGITPPPYTKHVLIWSELVQFSMNTCCPPLFLSRYVIFLWGKVMGNVATTKP